MEADTVCIGDYICFYCEETSGFVYSDQTSAAYNGCFVYNNQDRDAPENIPNVHAVTFQIVSQNRYKLEKKYRRLQNETIPDKDSERLSRLQQAKTSADAEREDNAAEQARLRGKQLKYGYSVQLRHVLTNKYIHISTTDTSVVDKNKMMVKLEPYNAKHAQFRIMPRYKVKMEGERVDVNDRIVLESVKSPGTYLHASLPYHVTHIDIGSELNLSVEVTTFTIMHHYRPVEGDSDTIKGGSVINLFHKELQAHLTAEGIFDEEPAEEVHLRVREFNQMDIKTLFYPKSGISYWQVETTKSLLHGQVIRWEDQVKLRHMTTRLYLTLTEGQLTLTDDSQNPNAVFCFHAFNQASIENSSVPPEIAKKMQDDLLLSSMNARIQHVLTGSWIHASKDNLYLPNSYKKSEQGSMDRLRAHKTTLLKVECSADQQFPDTFTVQKVAEDDVQRFNYVACMVPFVRDLITDREKGIRWSAKRCVNICSAFTQLRDYMVVDKQPIKDMQKLLRNLKVVEVLVDLLACKADDIADWEQLSSVFCAIYDVLHAYTRGNSKKNALYLAKYIQFFHTHLGRSRGVGLQCCIMLTDLIKDNRKIVDRIHHSLISHIIQLLAKNKNYRFLELLGVFCVCSDIAISENQSLIAHELLEDNKGVMCQLEMGEDIQRQENTIYVSIGNRDKWHPLHKFSFKSNREYDEEQYLFLETQLDLYKQLCYGRNKDAIKVVTKTKGYFTWDVAFRGMASELLPDKTRARFCDLIIGLFVDIGDNFSTLELTSTNFAYDEIDETDPSKEDIPSVPKKLQKHFPEVRHWLDNFFRYNTCLYASNIGYNLFIKEVLRLTFYLVNYGYFSSRQSMTELLSHLLNFVDGQNDAPYPPDKGCVYSKKERVEIEEFRKRDRFKPSPETEAIVEAKSQGLDLIELMMEKLIYKKVKYLVSVFKGMVSPDQKKTKKTIMSLTEDTFDPETFWTKSALRSDVDSLLKKVMKATDVISSELPVILLDLTNYSSDSLITNAMDLLHDYYSSRKTVFTAVTDAQILMTDQSKSLHAQAKESILVLRRLSRRRVNKTELATISDILRGYREGCRDATNPSKSNHVAQKILTNNGLWELLYTIATQEVDFSLADRYNIAKAAISDALLTMRSITVGNKQVKEWNVDHLDRLLEIETCGAELGLLLAETFSESPVKALQIEPRQVQRIVRLAGKHQHLAPELPQLLKVLVKDETTGMVLQRNQTLVVKYIMESYKTAAYVMNMPWERRLQILIGREGKSHRKYLIAVVDLLATCAQGPSRYIESLCQTLLSVEEIMCILNNRNIEMAYKPAFANYLVWGYMRTARSKVESGMERFSHDESMWKHIGILWTVMARICHKDQLPPAADIQKQPPDLQQVMRDSIDNEKIDEPGSAIYLLNGGLMLLQTFFQIYYQVDTATHMEELGHLRRLQNIFMSYTMCLIKFVTTNSHVTSCEETLEVLTKKAYDYNPDLALMDILSQRRGEINTAINRQREPDEESDLNKRLNCLSDNLSIYIQGWNRVTFQLGIKSKAVKDKEYVDPDDDVKLPLGLEFQQHVSCFVIHKAKTCSQRYMMTQKLIKQLESSERNRISSVLYKMEAPQEQEQLDVTTLRILRTMMYNLVVQLPDNWEENTNKNKKLLRKIYELQMTLHKFDIISKVLPLMGRKNPDISREVLALVDILLFNACKELQRDLMLFFNSTAEETFFVFIRERLQLASVVIKEKRSLAAQQRHIQKTKDKRLEKERKKLLQSEQQFDFIEDEVRIDSRARKKKALKPYIRQKLANKLLVLGNDYEMKELEEEEDTELMTMPVSSTSSSESILDMYEDTGDINLVMRILARMCDGQYREIQDYLRGQEDNVRSVDLVAEITQFVGVLYAHVNDSNIALLSQTFSTLNEMSQGNQENRSVILNNKIIDYINYIIRQNRYEGCTPQADMGLRQEMAQLLRSMIEENAPDARQVAKDVCDTIDVPSLKRMFVTCHEMVEEIGHGDDLADAADEVGFLLYFVLSRFRDVSPNIVLTSYAETMAFEDYRKQCKSVEVLKDGHLQKVDFRVNNQELLREEIKETVKWNIDRSSPMAKHRDLVCWTYDILNDFNYQKTVLKYPIAVNLSKLWNVWNYSCVLLSLVINIMMMVTWVSPFGLDDAEDYFEENNDTDEMPGEIYDPVPELSWDAYQFWLYVIGVIHNICCIILFLSFLVLKHPRLPDCSWLTSRCTLKAFREDEVDEDEIEGERKRKQRTSKLEVQLFSAMTLYYLLLVIFSILGTIFYGYFFAFHLLNIITMNQLLKGVVRAITQNGVSLLWVTVLGFIVLYIYGLIGFAFYRSTFDPDADEMAAFCDNLAECVLTVVKYGSMGEISAAMILHENERNVLRFGLLAIYQVTFFIIFTTIGLNIIFGIIVDTFSELRDLKWAAEKDMRDSCFICSRDSYDFEQTGQGFSHHVNMEHNMWAYIFYFIHLHETNEKDYSSIDLYVARMLEAEKLDFFPLDQAMCLTTSDEGNTEDKLDDLINTVLQIHTFQKRKAERKIRQLEKERQYEALRGRNHLTPAP